jgi:hypothetical protein
MNIQAFLQTSFDDLVGFLKLDIDQRAFETYLGEARTHAELEQRERAWNRRSLGALRFLART